MPSYEFTLHIGPDAYLDYYRGTASVVVVDTTEGVSLQFPASFLRPFVTSSGVAGRFRIACDDRHKCLDLRKIGP
jgi:hypothetical protein